MFSGPASLSVHSQLALRTSKVHRVQSNLSPLEWAHIITGDSAAASTQQLTPGSLTLRTHLRRTAKYTPLLVWLGTPPRYQPNESTDGWVGSYTARPRWIRERPCGTNTQVCLSVTEGRTIGTVTLALANAISLHLLPASRGCRQRNLAIKSGAERETSRIRRRHGTSCFNISPRPAT